MDILKATYFDGYLEHGGSTKPWKVFLHQKDNTEAPYVVKLFSQRNIDQQHAVAKEVYGNILAKQFSLPVPDIALVDFDAWFITTCLEPSERNILNIKHEGLKFASKLAESMFIVAPHLYKNFLREYDVANVYAFDTLIGNIDRGGARNKPNLIVDDEAFLLIDHEQIFTFADTFTKDAYKTLIAKFENNISSYLFQRHLLYPILKNFRNIDKRHIFDEFGEYLAKMQTSDLEDHMKSLLTLEVSTGNWTLILEYLYKIKSNHNKFCDILLSTIA